MKRIEIIRGSYRTSDIGKIIECSGYFRIMSGRGSEYLKLKDNRAMIVSEDYVMPIVEKEGGKYAPCILVNPEKWSKEDKKFFDYLLRNEC
jgi:hypothetical protein